ncbi:MAG TPA: chlorite dismutase family protein [Candidatus Eisenbacteria bacterium]|nr:chlorite dismutase family protein [Candidatus Eisenbacteria bacterium]
MAEGIDLSERRFVHALALGLDPAWRRLPVEERFESAEDLVAAVRLESEVTTHCYSMVGLQPGADLLLWSLGPTLDSIEERSAMALRSGMGKWMRVQESFLGVIQPSQYVKKPTPQEQSLFSGERSRYLVVYPFTKSAEWYQLPAEERQRIMNGHMKIGHGYPEVRQLLAYSFGLDDMDFLVAYETDDLPKFGELVRALRATESRLSTVRDTPILTGIHRPIEEITELLGATADSR